MKFNESKMTNRILDAISTYTASAAMSNKNFSKLDCLHYIAEQTKFNIADIDEAYGIIIEDELNRLSKNEIDESLEKFSTTLLKEDTATDVNDNVQKAAAKNTNGDEHQENTTQDTTRKYYLYSNAMTGQLFICSVDMDKAQANKDKLSNMIKSICRVNGTQHIKGKGILVTPIDQNEAAAIVKAKKIKYYDLTKQLNAEKEENAKNNAAEEQKKAEQNYKL